jgi:hypothetical protein
VPPVCGGGVDCVAIGALSAAGISAEEGGGLIDGAVVGDDNASDVFDGFGPGSGSGVDADLEADGISDCAMAARSANRKPSFDIAGAVDGGTAACVTDGGWTDGGRIVGGDALTGEA